MLGRDEIVSILDDIGRNSRRTVIWEPEIPRPRTEVRLAFLALLCCETAMPFDGTVRVRKEGYAWTITGESENLTIDDTLWDTLTNPEAPTALTPAQVQFALLPIVAADLGQKISLEKSQTEITIKI